MAAGAAILFLHFPILIILLYAFTTEEASFHFPPPGLTGQWFGVLFNRDDFWQAFVLSLRVATVATLIALILGTITASAIYRSDFFGREAFSLLVILPIALQIGRASCRERV